MDNIQEIELDKISASFGNDRTTFDPAALRDLAESIRATSGVVQPVTLRRMPDGRYQLIAGERRTRASMLLWADDELFAQFCALFALEFSNPFTTIRAIVRELSDSESAVVMLSENTGRKDLDPIDEARAYARRMQDYGWDEKTCADRAGVNIQIIRNRLALLSLRTDIQFLVRSGNLTVGYAQIIAESNLDNNRQLIALKRLNECPAPSPSWLRKTCAELAEQQDSNDMFADALFAASDFSATQKKQEFTQKLPADPRKDSAPMIGNTYQQMISGQVQFWMDAADKWDRYGKSAQRDRCLAAMSALQAIVQIMPQHSNKSRSVKQGTKTYAVYQTARV